MFIQTIAMYHAVQSLICETTLAFRRCAVRLSTREVLLFASDLLDLCPTFSGTDCLDLPCGLELFQCFPPDGAGFSSNCVVKVCWHVTGFWSCGRFLSLIARVPISILRPYKSNLFYGKICREETPMLLV